MAQLFTDQYLVGDILKIAAELRPEGLIYGPRRARKIKACFHDHGLENRNLCLKKFAGPSRQHDLQSAIYDLTANSINNDS